MAKFHARPSNQYRYEHYDPRDRGMGSSIQGIYSS
jgi:hypothetical protein